MVPKFGVEVKNHDSPNFSTPPWELRFEPPIPNFTLSPVTRTCRNPSETLFETNYKLSFWHHFFVYFHQNSWNCALTFKFQLRGIKNNPPLRVQNRRSLEGFLFFWDFELRKKLGGFYFSEIFGILAWVLLVNLSTFLAWFYYQIWPKKPKIFRRFAPNRVGFFIFIENLQNFGRGFLIEGGFNFNTPVPIFQYCTVTEYES